MMLGTRRRLLLAAVGAITMGGVLVGGTSPAWADIAVESNPMFPAAVTVGQTGLPGHIHITNTSNGINTTDTLVLDQITLTPSCGAPTSPPAQHCQAYALDPGVFQPSTTGVGSAGTACAGTTFTISLINAASGTYQFVPSAPVLLLPPGTSADTCNIDFTFDVLKEPAHGYPFPQPSNRTLAFAFSSGHNLQGQAARLAAGAVVITVSRGSVPIATQVAPGALSLGSSFQATAMLTPTAGAALPAGAVRFNVYGPDDATCATAPVFTSTNPLNAAGTTAVSGSFTPASAGTYRVIATYSGDANYDSSASMCADPGAVVIVTAPPTQSPPPTLPQTGQHRAMPPVQTGTSAGPFGGTALVLLLVGLAWQLGLRRYRRTS